MEDGLHSKSRVHCSNPPLPQFFDGFVGEMKHINKIGYPWLAHVNTWCDGSASRKWAWWSKDRILGHAVFFTWIFMCPNFILVFLVFNTPVSTYFCLQHFSVQFIGRLLSNLYCEKVSLKFFSRHSSIFPVGTWWFLDVVRDEFA